MTVAKLGEKDLHGVEGDVLAAAKGYLRRFGTISNDSESGLPWALGSALAEAKRHGGEHADAICKAMITLFLNCVDDVLAKHGFARPVSPGSRYCPDKPPTSPGMT